MCSLPSLLPLAGDVGHVKLDATGSVHYPLHSLLSFHLHASLGVLKPLAFGGLCSPHSNASDRFYLGGPLTLRGFEQGGVGPRSDPSEPGADGGDALGGEVYHISSLHLSTPFPLPLLAGQGLRLFAFGCVGNLLNWSELGGGLGPVLGSARASLGAGVAAPTPVGR